MTHFDPKRLIDFEARLTISEKLNDIYAETPVVIAMPNVILA